MYEKMWDSSASIVLIMACKEYLKELLDEANAS